MSRRAASGVGLPTRTWLDAEPAAGLVDEVPRIRFGGTAPGTRVTLSAATTDGARVRWTSSAVFSADQDGGVNVAVQPAEHGSYHGVDPAGLFWSMQPAGAPGKFFTRRRPNPLYVTVTAAVDGVELATVEIERRFAGPETTSLRLEGPDLVGTLYAPRGGQWPGVIVLSGSDGGELGHAAALLATHGYAVLSLAYFGAEDLPATLERIDLDYFDRALAWLARRPEVSDGPLALVGLSRGAELALQLASMHDTVGPVVAGAPSGLRHAGLTSNYTDYTQPAWLFDGEPLPFVSGKFTVRDAIGFVGVFALRRPMRLISTFRRSVRRDPRATAAASIPVERIKGPVLLISGGADQLWQSREFAAQVMARRGAHACHAHDRHLDYPDAGHFVCFPYALPTLPPMNRLKPIPHLAIDFGGTAAANADSARRSWPEILDFLARHARREQRSGLEGA